MEFLSTLCTRKNFIRITRFMRWHVEWRFCKRRIRRLMWLCIVNSVLWGRKNIFTTRVAKLGFAIEQLATAALLFYLVMPVRLRASLYLISTRINQFVDRRTNHSYEKYFFHIFLLLYQIETVLRATAVENFLNECVLKLLSKTSNRWRRKKGFFNDNENKVFLFFFFST